VIGKIRPFRIRRTTDDEQNNGKKKRGGKEIFCAIDLHDRMMLAGIAADEAVRELSEQARYAEPVRALTSAKGVGLLSAMVV